MASKRIQIDAIKEHAVQLYHKLMIANVHADVILLFGSYARGQAHADSDIDLCVVSRDYGKDPIMEGAKANLIASKINSRIEVVTVSLYEYFERMPLSPILHEIKKTGICIL